MSRDRVQVFRRGCRAARGGRPLGVWRCGYHRYVLLVGSYRWTLRWDQWTGYRCDASAKVIGGRVVDVVYYTY